MPKARTHFEQIPLVVVKKIAEGDVSKDERPETDDVMVEPAPGKRKRQNVPARPPRTKVR